MKYFLWILLFFKNYLNFLIKVAEFNKKLDLLNDSEAITFIENHFEKIFNT